MGYVDARNVGRKQLRYKYDILSASTWHLSSIRLNFIRYTVPETKPKTL
jgi:hypothetical protein